MNNFFIKRTKQKPLINKQFINKSFTDLQQVWNHLVGGLAIKKSNENEEKSKTHDSSMRRTIRRSSGPYLPRDGNSNSSYSQYASYSSSLGSPRIAENSPHTGWIPGVELSDLEESPSSFHSLDHIAHLNLGAGEESTEIALDTASILSVDHLEFESARQSNAGSPWSGNSSIYFDIEDNINGHDNQTQIRTDSWNPEPRSTTARQNNDIRLINDRYPIDAGFRHIGVQADFNSHVIDHEVQCRSNHSIRKVTFEWTFVITNFALEVISTVLDQLSSVNNSGYAIVVYCCN
ncbi:hypothetical protein ACOSP7_004168 [Xanthoceras sorbifolium]